MAENKDLTTIGEDKVFAGGVQLADGTTPVQLTDAASGFTSKLFKNIVSADHMRFAGFTPFIGGRGFFIVTRMPRYMEIGFVQHSRVFKKLIQFYVKAITGFQDRSLTFTAIENGIEEAGVEVATSISGATKELAFQFGPDPKGLPISKYTKLWMEGIVDPRTHEAHYHGVDLPYEQINHTMEGIYFITDPSRKEIQAHAYICNMMPKLGPMSMMDFTQGQHDFYEPNISFSAQVFENNLTIGQFLNEAKVLDLFDTSRSYTFELNEQPGGLNILGPAKDFSIE